MHCNDFSQIAMTSQEQPSDQEQAALAFLRPDETAAQFLARSHVPPFLSGVGFIDRRVPLRPGCVLEISGLAGTGKTELLLNVAATCLLPHESGGHCGHVLFFDLDCKFDVLRLIQILQGRILCSLQAAGMHYGGGTEAEHAAEQHVTQVITDSMQRLTLVRCPTSFHFLAALKVAKPVLTRMAGGLAAVLVDNVTAHYYSDKAAKSAGAVPGGAHHRLTRDGAPLTLYRVHAAVAGGLKHLQQVQRVPVIATKHILTAGGKDGDAWAARDVMMKPWQDCVTHRMALRRSGGGSHGAAPGSMPASSGHLAKWMKPDLPHVDKFSIARSGVVPAS